MSLSAEAFGRVLCSGSGCSTWSSSGGGCWKVRSNNSAAQRAQRKRADCPFPALQAEGVAVGYGRCCGRENNNYCAGSTRCFADRFAGEVRSSKGRSGRVWCGVGGGGSNVTVEDWTKKLPAKRKALYSHSLPCIEAWLHSLGFVQNKEDRAVWTIERPDWHAQLSLDTTDLYIRYLKKGPGNLERDIERKFSYALSREDLENAILGGP